MTTTILRPVRVSVVQLSLNRGVAVLVRGPAAVRGLNCTLSLVECDTVHKAHAAIENARDEFIPTHGRVDGVLESRAVADKALYPTAR